MKSNHSCTHDIGWTVSGKRRVKDGRDTQSVGLLHNSYQAFLSLVYLYPGPPRVAGWPEHPGDMAWCRRNSQYFYPSNLVLKMANFRVARLIFVWQPSPNPLLTDWHPTPRADSLREYFAAWKTWSTQWVVRHRIHARVDLWDPSMFWGNNRVSVGSQLGQHAVFSGVYS